jgi:cytochrome c-type biogenesis protein CcmH/NrfF
MRLLWWVPIVIVVGAGVVMRLRRRRHDDVALTSEPVSADWLAQARGRDEHRW